MWDDKRKSHKSETTGRTPGRKYAFATIAQQGIARKGQENASRCEVLRNTEARKKVALSVFAGKDSITLTLNVAITDDNTPTKKRKLQTNIRLYMQSPQLTGQGQEEVNNKEIGADLIENVEKLVILRRQELSCA